MITMKSIRHYIVISAQLWLHRPSAPPVDGAGQEAPHRRVQQKAEIGDDDAMTATAH
jgi:hypothetical protein